MTIDVDVLPLAPPFFGSVLFLRFADGTVLAVSKADGNKIRALFGTDLTNRHITLAAADDGVHIRIRAVPS